MLCNMDRIANSSSTIIDLTITNVKNYTAGVGVISVADHLMNFIILDSKFTKPNHRFVTSRNFKRLDTKKFLDDLTLVPWYIIECFDNINDTWMAWKFLFDDVVNHHAPLKKFRASKSQIPWYDEKIEILMQMRDQLHNKAIITDSIEDWAQFKKMKNRVTTLVRKAKTEFYTNGIKENHGNARGMWRLLKGLLPKCSQNSITSLYINDTLVSNFQQIADCFNDYFIEIGTKLSQQIQTTLVSALDYVSKFLPQFSGKFTFKRISSHDVEKLLAELPRDKATGLDNLQPRLLKMASPTISNSLAYIYNMSLSLGSFPDAWKMARVSAIHKKVPKLTQEIIDLFLFYL